MGRSCCTRQQVEAYISTEAVVVDAIALVVQDGWKERCDQSDVRAQRKHLPCFPLSRGRSNRRFIEYTPGKAAEPTDIDQAHAADTRVVRRAGNSGTLIQNSRHWHTAADNHHTCEINRPAPTRDCKKPPACSSVSAQAFPLLFISKSRN